MGKNHGLSRKDGAEWPGNKLPPFNYEPAYTWYIILFVSPLVVRPVLMQSDTYMDRKSRFPGIFFPSARFEHRTRTTVRMNFGFPSPPLLIPGRAGAHPYVPSRIFTPPPPSLLWQFIGTSYFVVGT